MRWLLENITFHAPSKSLSESEVAEGGSGYNCDMHGSENCDFYVRPVQMHFLALVAKVNKFLLFCDGRRLPILKEGMGRGENLPPYAKRSPINIPQAIKNYSKQYPPSLTRNSSAQKKKEREENKRKR